MNKAIVIFLANDKKYLFELTNNLVLEVGDRIIVDTDQAREIATIVDIGNNFDEKNDFEKGIGEITEKITCKHAEVIEKNKEKAQQLLAKCKDLVAKHLLPMKLVNAELSIDGRKITIFFSADGRIDFRNLVVDLAKKLKKIIRLQQVGSRDEAKFFTSIGKCGQELCCHRFNKKIDSVTLDVAKDQGITSNTNKISGLCGKLMCCLNYELCEYKRLKTGLPIVGQIIKTKKGDGKVIEQQILKRKVVALLENGDRIEVEL